VHNWIFAMLRGRTWAYHLLLATPTILFTGFPPPRGQAHCCCTYTAAAATVTGLHDCRKDMRRHVLHKRALLAAAQVRLLREHPELFT
jgi:hypothetical protein